MESILETIHRANELNLPPRFLIYGGEGIGKSTLAANAPSAVFIQTEDGLGEIDCKAFPLAKTFEDIQKYLWALETEDHNYRTVVIDTADWLERIVHLQVCEDHGCKSIEDIGYSKGYKFAVDFWMELLERLNTLRIEKGMAVIILAHAKLERVEDPEHPAFDRYCPDLHRLVCSTLVEWADAVLFAKYNLKLKTEDLGFGKKRQIASTVKDAQTQSNRVLRCIGGPACIAKNRYSMPSEIPMEWQAIIESMITNVN